MKKRILIAAAVLAMLIPQAVKANEIVNATATAYCPTGRLTATQTVPKEGRTIAGKREWFGKTLMVFEDKGYGIAPENYLGTFICEDTSKAGSPVAAGRVVDILIEDYERAVQFGSKKVIIYIIDSEG